MFQREQPPNGHGELPSSLRRYIWLGKYWTRKSNISSSRGNSMSASPASAPTVSPPRSENENSKLKPSRTSTPTNVSHDNVVPSATDQWWLKPPHCSRISSVSRASAIVDHAWPNLSSPPAYVVSPPQPKITQRTFAPPWSGSQFSSSPPNLYGMSLWCWY